MGAESDTPRPTSDSEASPAGGDRRERMLTSVRRFARGHLDGARGSHAWDHTLRVCRLCAHIGAVEGVDETVVTTAAYLHDIGRGRQDRSNGSICHACEGARMAAPFVDTLELSDAQKDNILHCVRSHRFRGAQAPQTPEARVLFDADKLDAIGAVGVARAFLFAGEVGARLHSPEMAVADTQPYTEHDTGYREYVVKLHRIKARILTREGRRLADGRHAFMEAFFERFLEEFEGKR